MGICSGEYEGIRRALSAVYKRLDTFIVLLVLPRHGPSRSAFAPLRPRNKDGEV
jgi:hypothetical protein